MDLPGLHADAPEKLRALGLRGNQPRLQLENGVGWRPLDAVQDLAAFEPHADKALGRALKDHLGVRAKTATAEIVKDEGRRALTAGNHRVPCLQRRLIALDLDGLAVPPYLDLAFVLIEADFARL